MFRNSPCKRIFALALLVAMCLTILSGCSPKEPTDETTTTPVKVNESYLDELREKGKLVVGVKTDVPELSYYDKETGEWSGLEVELAYNIGCDLFGVNRSDLGDKVKLVGVTVADREETLQNGDSIVIFPETGLPHFAHGGVNEFYHGFAMLGEIYRRKTGQDVGFCPLYIDKKTRTLRFGELVTYGDLPAAEEYRRVSDDVREQMLALAGMG